MKKIIVLFTFFLILFAGNLDFVKPDKAFKVQITQEKNKIIINLKLHKDIYVYHDKIKIFLDKNNITKEVFKTKPIKYHEFLVHFNALYINIPTNLIKKYNAKKLTFKYQGCSKKGLCYTPMQKEYNINQTITTKNKTNIRTNNADESANIADMLKNANIFIVLGSFFIFGLLLSLTPCIFPMIPILSSILIQQANIKGKKLSAKNGFFIALVYVLSMSVAYTIAGILAGLFGTNLQVALQNPVVLVIFSLIFVFLAFSLFGYYNIELPQSLQNKINQISGKKSGIIGVAIMGFLSALIVGPCVAPPLAGALLYIGQTGDALLGGSALFIMSLGLGMPLLLIGLGANKLMPKPGGWMESVSKFFGIIMLALAIYMLDRIIEPIFSNILYTILFIFSIFYMIKQKNKLSYIFATISLILALFFTNIIFKQVNSKNLNELNFVKVDKISKLNNIINSSKKPVLVDIGAKWCVSCKELEEITFKNKAVINELKKYKLIKFDITNNTKEDKALLTKYNLFGPPAILIFKNGKLTTKIIGFKKPKEFLKFLK